MRVHNMRIQQDISDMSLNSKTDNILIYMFFPLPVISKTRICILKWEDEKSSLIKLTHMGVVAMHSSFENQKTVNEFLERLQ